MPAKRTHPRLIDYQGARCCSICKMPIPPDAKPSIAEAFAQHVINAHKHGQTCEDENQAADR